jgi:hypothetical protein
MKILPDAPSLALDLPAVSPARTASFEDSLGLAATLRIRQSRSRAFAFAERGMLSPSDSRTAPSAWPSPDVALAAEGIGSPLPIQPPAAGGDIAKAEARMDVEPRGLGIEARTRPETARTTEMASAMTTHQSALGAAPRRPPPLPPADGTTGRVVKATPPRPDGSSPSSSSDVALTVQRTAEGILVIAASGDLSPSAIANLRARAEAVARDHGERLVEFRLNGVLIAPQPLSRRT